MRRNVVIILPTYNERKNIAKLLQEILKQCTVLKNVYLSILVVDDSSQDGTATVVKSYKKKYKNIHILSGKKQGLGVAYVRGFHYAIETLKADVVFQMDADFSHDPHDIPRFLHEIAKGKDFVIGSRYITGGSIPPNWSLLRRINSRWGNIFARHIAGLRPVRDCTSGYRAITTVTLRKIDLDKIGVSGYAFMMNLLYQARMSNADIFEIPIHFVERTHGKSKIRMADVSEFIISAFYLRFPLLKKIFHSSSSKKVLVKFTH